MKLITITQADEKLGIAFGLRDDHTGVCTIENIQLILRCMHQVLGKMVTSEIPSDEDEFLTLLLNHIHEVASIDGACHIKHSRMIC